MHVRAVGTGWSLTVLLLCVGLASQAGAQSRQLPPELQATLLAKVMSFEKGVHDRGRDSLVIGIAFQSDWSRSREQMIAMRRALRSPELAQVVGAPIRVIEVPVGAGGELPFSLEDRGIVVMYLAIVRGVRPHLVAAACSSAGALVFSGEEERNVAVRLTLAGDRPVVQIDLVQVKAAGAEFSSQLLRHVQIVGSHQ